MAREGPRPQCWKYADPMMHAKHIPFLRMKCQATFRGEVWTLTFDEFLSYWTDELWAQRGRTKDSLCLSRIDQKGVWSNDNVEICKRLKMLKKKTKDQRNDSGVRTI